MILSLAYTAVSWIASIVIAFANVGALAEAPNTPAWDGQAYRKSMSKNLALGRAPEWDITFDETLTEAFDRLTEETGMDIPEAVAGLKDMYRHHRWIVKLFPGIFYGLRDRWMEKGDQWERDGDGTKMVLYRLLGICAGMPTKVFIYTEPKEDVENEYNLHIQCTYADGSKRSFFTYSVYNSDTGLFGEDNGISSLGYNFNFNSAMAYTTKDPFQRSLGYMKLYDNLLLKTTKMVNVDTVRLKFPYKGMDWMLQLWKGRYFNTTGGEIGIYHKPKSRLIEFYNAVSDEERIYMSFKITTDDRTIDNPVLIDREVTYHWWMTGFAVRPKLYTPNRLTLGSVVVPTDGEMYEGMKVALDREKVSYEETEWDNPETVEIEELPALEITW